MTHTRRVAIEGILPSNPSSSDLQNNIENETFEHIISDILSLERFLNGGESPTDGATNISKNCINYLKASEIGNHKLQHLKISRDYGTRKLTQYGMMKEVEFPLESLDKVFCSAWLNDRQILFGTKCNKLIVLDINTKKMVQIPNLRCTSNNSIPPKNQCGIHALKINPSGTLVATGGQNSNDVAVYKLPTLDPVFVGVNAHKDWVFDITWLDDEFFVSGSRDTMVALWRVTDQDLNQCGRVSCSNSLPYCSVRRPLKIQKCQHAEKVRALLFNERSQELVALSLNAYLHLFDAQTFKQKFSRKLPNSLENVCIAQQLDHNLYAIGSRSYVSIVDSRTLLPGQKIPSKYQACGIRSLSFLGNLLTIGTGVGVVLFFDIRANRYLEKILSPLSTGINGSEKPSERFEKRFFRFGDQIQPATLRTTRGFPYPDPDYEEHIHNFHYLEYNPAIYTHCYDTSGTRLFLAGGPLPVKLQGNYAALWQ